MLTKQKKFFLENHTRNVALRELKLRKLKTAIKKYETDISDALYADLGKSEFEAYATEIGFVLSSLSEMIKNIRSYAKDKRVRAKIHQPFSKNYIKYVPYGTVLIIGPFNYPFQLVMEPLLGSVAAGNTVSIKPSEFTPNVNKVIIKILSEVFEPEWVNVVEGEVKETTELLNGDIDYVFFTGSVEVGKIVAATCAKRLIPYTLELGGKSPVVIMLDAKLKHAAKRIVWAKFLNAGQTCVAPDYVYIHEDIKDKFIGYVKQFIEEFYPHSLENKDYGKIINHRHHKRISELIDQDKVVIGGAYDHDKIEPTVLDNITWDDVVMQEEIFGPILPILTYDDNTDLLSEIRRSNNPLAFYLFTHDKKIINKYTEEFQFGGGCINDCITHLTNPALPFGGVGESGVGQYHGKDNFLTFSHKKSISKKPTWFDLKLVYPPYKNNVKWVKKIMK